VRIADMARDLIRLHGLDPDTDVPIVYTGLRPGEKLYEELITEGEGIVDTRHRRIKVIRGDHCDLTALSESINHIIDAAKNYDVQGIRKGLKAIVQEYQPSMEPEGKVKQRNRIS